AGSTSASRPATSGAVHCGPRQTNVSSLRVRPPRPNAKPMLMPRAESDSAGNASAHAVFIDGTVTDAPSTSSERPGVSELNAELDIAKVQSTKNAILPKPPLRN